ncbi:hypothetical protein EDB87DRAFT_1621378 [Lactarius vividus]|nr:hypothetical protein EDB87DRAFT_1621378 [Lactarius vividus]
MLRTLQHQWQQGPSKSAVHVRASERYPPLIPVIPSQNLVKSQYAHAAASRTHPIQCPSLRPLRHGCQPAPRAPKEPFLILLLLQCPLPGPCGSFTCVITAALPTSIFSSSSTRPLPSRTSSPSSPIARRSLQAHAARREALLCVLGGGKGGGGAAISASVNAHVIDSVNCRNKWGKVCLLCRGLRCFSLWQNGISVERVLSRHL